MAGVGNFLGRLFYATEVETAGIDRGLASMESKVSAAIDRLESEDATVELKAERKQLDKELKEARAELEKFDKSEYQAELGLDDSEFNAKYRVVRTKVDYLDAKRIDVTVRMDEHGQFSRDARRVGREVEHVDNLFGSLARKVSSARINLGPFTLTLRSLIPVVATLAPILTDLVGGIVALSGSLTEAAAGGLAVAAAGFTGLALSATGAVLAIKPVITDFKTAASAATALRTAQLKYGKSSDQARDAQKVLNSVLKEMPPAAGDAARAWADLRTEFERRTGSIRTDFFGGIDEALRTANDLLPDFARQASLTFSVARDGFDEWMEGLRSAEGHDILNTIMGNFRRSLPTILHGLGQFATAFGRIMAAASEFLPSFTRGFDRVGIEFANSTRNAGDLRQTMGDLTGQFHSWMDLLGATGRLLTTIFVGGADQGQTMIEDLTATFNGWNRTLQTARGQNELRGFFDDAATGTEQFVGLLRRLISFFFQIGRLTAPLATGLLTFVNALADVVTMAARLTPVKAILAGIGAAIAANFVATRVVAFGQALALLPAQIRAVGVAAVTAESLVNPLIGLFSLAVGAATALGVGFFGLGDATGQMASSQDRATAAAHRATTAMHDEAAAVRALRGDTLNLKQAHLDVAIAKNEERRTGRALRKVLKDDDATTQEVTDAKLSHRQAELSLAQAQRGENEALRTQRGDLQAVFRQGNKVAQGYQDRLIALKDTRSGIRGEIQDSKDLIAHYRDVGGMEEEVAAEEANLKDKRDQLKNVTKQIRGVTKDYNDALDKTNQRSDKAARLTQNLRGDVRALNSPLGSVTRALAQVSKSMFGVGLTSKGMGTMIGAVTNKILGQFGAKVLNFSLPAVSAFMSSVFGTHQTGGVVGEQKRAGGGFIVPGRGDGDTYRTALPPGAFILNRNATRAMGFQSGGMAPVALEPGELALAPGTAKRIGYGALNAINGAVPRFAKGGTIGKPIELLWQVPDHYDHLHAAFGSTAETISAGRKIQGLGYEVGEGPGPFGPITPGVHASGSYHYSNQAIDVNDDAPPIAFGGSESASLSHLFAMLKSGQLTGGVTSIPRLLVKGPAGPLLDALQGQSDRLRKAANAYIAKHMPSASGSVGGWKGINSAQEFIPFWNQVNPAVRWAANAFSRIVPAESGWNARASNGTHFGWYQFDSPTWSDFAPSGSPGAPEGPYDPGLATVAAGNVAEREGKSGIMSRWAATFSGFQRGGYVEDTSGGLPDTQRLRLPPKPRFGRKRDFSTAPGHWYDWFGRAIDFYDARGDTRSDAGDFPHATGDWRDAMHNIVSEEEQIRRIIRHNTHNIKRLKHRKQHLPKHLRKSEPPKHFRFRNRKKGESQKEYNKAKHVHRRAWKRNRRDWERQRKDYRKQISERQEVLRQEQPDLYSQLRIDLPTRYNEIREKITGQAADRELEQTAFGQERYRALLDYGANFFPMASAVGAGGSRNELPGVIPGMSGTRAPRTSAPAVGPAALAASMRTPSALSGATGRTGGSSGSVNVHNRTTQVHNHYKTMPRDPHTWSRNLKWELESLS